LASENWATIVILSLVCVASLPTTTSSTVVATSAPVDVSVVPPTVPVGQSFDVHFTVNSQFQGQANATVEVGTCSGCSNIWKSLHMGVYFGYSYDVAAPGISTPGKYFVTVLIVIPGPLGGAAIGGGATFEVVASVTQTQVRSSTSRTTTRTVRESSTTSTQAPFDFSISVSPTERTVTPGQSAAYVVIVNLISGTPVHVQLGIKNMPAGITASFDPQSGKPPYNSLLTVSTTQSASAGQVAIRVRGTGGGRERDANFTLMVSGQTQTTSPQNLSNSSQPNQAAFFVGLIQQNGLVIVGLLVILVVIVAVIFARSRKPKPIPKP